MPAKNNQGVVNMDGLHEFSQWLQWLLIPLMAYVVKIERRLTVLETKDGARTEKAVLDALRKANIEPSIGNGK
jgi:uncharacterized protein YqcC (DUF446 family)